MAQAILLPTPALHHIAPSSPDPTPLRMLAFSVAEAALSSNPNSPMFDIGGKNRLPTPPLDVADVAWASGQPGMWTQVKPAEKSLASRRGKMVWNVLERAKERKEKTCGPVPPISPPISPASYNFVLPANSSLAASIARQTATPPPPPALSVQVRNNLPLFTRSAEPSPTKSTFSSLDQTRPPPEFVPRLSAQEFSQQARKASVSAAAAGLERRRSSIETVAIPEVDSNTLSHANAARPSRRARLPSLQQIQAKMSGSPSSLRRSGSVDNLSRSLQHMRSEESLEVLVTPEDEIPNPLRDRRMALRAIMDRRPTSPPSDAKLLPFLRERTSGRLATRPITPERLARPVLKVTPPSFESRPAVPPLRLGQAAAPTSHPRASGFVTPTESRFIIPAITRLTTPPPKSSSPSSPTESVRSLRSTSTGNGSPTLSMPIITCTPAPEGLDQESDDGSDASGDVIVFDGEAEEREREERERRGTEMRAKLGLRRRSVD